MDTAQTIIDRVLVRLEDEDNSFFTTADLVLAYNDAIDEIADATEINESYVTVKRRKWSAYVDLRAYLPPDALRVTAVWNLSSSKWLIPTTVREMDNQMGREWEFSPEDSRYWWMRGLYFLGAYPVPDDGTSSLRVYFSCLFHHVEENGGLVSGLTSKTALPPDFAAAIEHYMMYQLLAQRKETKKALGFWKKYQTYEKMVEQAAKQRMSRDKTPKMGARRGPSMGSRRSGGFGKRRRFR